jgi:hypothetical protein
MRPLLIGRLNLLGFGFPGFEDQVDLPLNVLIEIMVFHVHNIESGNDLEDLVSEVTAQSLNQEELPSLRVDLLLVLHVPYLFKDLN